MYDPIDEKTDELFGTMVEILKAVPDRVARQALARLFEDAALLEAMLKQRGGDLDPESVESTLTAHWDEVQAGRNERAADFLYSIQSMEY